LKSLSINRIAFKNSYKFVVGHDREQVRDDLFNRYALSKVNLEKFSYKIFRNS
jgi:hypothetical protein